MNDQTKLNPEPQEGTDAPPSPQRATGRTAPEPRDEAYRDWIFTIPNLICMGRIAGSFVLFGLAVLQWPYAFVCLFLVLTISDWVDGYLARSLHQRSDFGARIDSFADFLLYSALLWGSVILCTDVYLQEWPLIALAVVSYFASAILGLIKYGKIPSYHTWAAKKTQFLVLAAGILLVLEVSVWPLRLAALAVLFTNLEMMALTWVLPEWQADVPSLKHILQTRDRDSNHGRRESGVSADSNQDS